MSTLQHPHPSSPDLRLPPPVRLLVVGVALVVLAAASAGADLRGPGGTLLFLGAVLAGSLDTRAGFAVLTAFAAWAVHTGFVTGHGGELGLSHGRWAALVVFVAAALLTWGADRVRTARR